MSVSKSNGQKVESNAGENPGVFPLTQWSKLVDLRENTGEERRAILDFLIRRYWKPVYCFVRRSGSDDEQAKDLVQEFFMVAIAKDLFSKADPERGRFRNFLLTSLKHFLANARREAFAKKRHPEEGFVSIHELSTQEGGPVIVLKNTETPDELFHRSWLRELVLCVLKTLETECLATDKRTHFELLRLRIIKPILEGAEAPSYQWLAKQFDLTEKEAAARVVTARRAYHRLLREEIRLYAASEKEVGEEIQDIWRFMAE